MNIAHVITRMIVGGAQENTLLSCAGQIAAGHRVTLITGPSEGPEGRLLERSQVDGLRLITLPSLVRQIHPLQDWRATRALRELCHQENYDVVHTHSSKAGIVGRAAAWDAGVKAVIHTIHGPAFHRYEKAWKNRLYIAAERYAAHRCHAIVSVAQAMTDQFLAAGIGRPELYSTVYSGMNLHPYLHAGEGLREKIRAQLQIRLDVPVVVKVARLFELKGHEQLLRAAALVIQQIPDIVFILVGDGLLREELQRRIEAAGWRQNFRFTGLVPPERVPDYIHAADILCHLSLREGLPRAVVQGLAAAKPAVAYALDGTPEIVLPGRTGMLCPPESVNEVAQALISLCRESTLRQSLGLAGREFVAARFSSERMVADLLSLYERLLEHKK